MQQKKFWKFSTKKKHLKFQNYDKSHSSFFVFSPDTSFLEHVSTRIYNPDRWKTQNLKKNPQKSKFWETSQGIFSFFLDLSFLYNDQACKFRKKSLHFLFLFPWSIDFNHQQKKVKMTILREREGLPNCQYWDFILLGNRTFRNLLELLEP